MSTINRIALLTFSLSCLIISSCAPPHKPKPKNVILISIDTLRADHLSCYGYKNNTSPNIDGYAKTGIQFQNAISSSSWTGPAHLSIMTSLSPKTHGLINYGSNNKLNDNTPTIASILSKNGFKTAAFTGGGWVSDTTGVDIGFQTFKSPNKRFKKNIDAAQYWLKAIEKKPFFLFLHGFDVHKPYRPPAPFNKKFAGNYTGHFDINNFQPNKQKPNQTDLSYVISQYDGEIANVDELLNNFFNYLKKYGLFKNTLIIITADHGDEFYEHGSIDHIHTLYDELIRVPLIIFGPTISPSTIESQVGTIDILPTILDILDIKYESSEFQGDSRIGLLHGKKTATIGDGICSYTGFEVYPYYLSSIRTSNWKLIHNNFSGLQNIVLQGNPDRPRYTYKFKKRTDDFYELYNLRKDPKEHHNLYNSNKKIAKKLGNMLKRHNRRYQKKNLNADKRGPMSKKQIESLKSLGYLK